MPKYVQVSSENFPPFPPPDGQHDCVGIVGVVRIVFNVEVVAVVVILVVIVVVVTVVVVHIGNNVGSDAAGGQDEVEEGEGAGDPDPGFGKSSRSVDNGGRKGKIARNS